MGLGPLYGDLPVVAPHWRVWRSVIPIATAQWLRMPCARRLVVPPVCGGLPAVAPRWRVLRGLLPVVAAMWLRKP